MGLSTACPLLFNQVQSPGNGASLVVLSALISGGAGAAAGAGVATTGVTEVLEAPLAFSSDSSCAIRAFISASSLITSSLLGGAAFALCGAVALPGVEVEL
jgi:hypothetical protein